MTGEAMALTGDVSNDPIAVLTARVERLEQEVKEAREIAEDADREARDAADDLDRLENDVRDLEREDSPDGDTYDEMQALRDEIRYLTNRLDRLEILQRSRGMSA